MKRNQIETTCDKCGKIIYQQRWQFESRKHHYCSKVCANNDISEQRTPYHKHKPLEVRKKLSDSLVQYYYQMGKRDDCQPCYKNDHPQRGPWCKEFIRKRPLIKKRDGDKCQMCGDVNSLHVHHIDYNFYNEADTNLITLCKHCHGTVNHNRGYWKNYFATHFKLECVETIHGTTDSSVEEIVQTATIIEIAELNRNIQPPIP